MKKVLSVMLALLMLVPLFSMESFAWGDEWAEFEKDGIYYMQTDDNEVCVYGYEYPEEGSEPTEVVIPETVRNRRITYTVTGVLDTAFTESNYSKITLPDTINYIGSEAFWASARLEEVVIPESCVLDYFGTDVFTGTPAEGKFFEKDVNTIGQNVLYSYTGDATEFAIPEEINILAAGCFMFSAIENVVFNENITDIPDFAFSCCRNLKEIEIPDDITMLGEAAFKDCMNLEKVILGESTEYIGINCFAGTKIKEINLPQYMADLSGAFNDCKYLEKITVDEANETFYADENALYSVYNYTDEYEEESYSEKKLEYFFGANTHSSYETDEDVTIIGDYAFYNNKTIKEFSASGVSSIGTKAFAGTEIETFNWQTSDDEYYWIYDSAFANCKNLKTIDLSNVEYIATAAFENCTSLKDVELSESIYCVDPHAFCNTAIEEIEIYGFDTFVGEGAFKDCANLKEVTLGDGVSLVDAFVFQNCPALETVYLSKTILVFAENALIDCEDVTFEVIKGSEGYKLVKSLDYNFEVVGKITFLEQLSNFFSNIFAFLFGWLFWL